MTALDASEGMIARVRGIEGVEAVHADFFWLDQHRAAFHGIWANFSLLHAAEDRNSICTSTPSERPCCRRGCYLGMKPGRYQARSIGTALRLLQPR